MNYLQMILAFMQLAPNVVSLVGQVQQAIGKGNGPTKKAIVMTALAHPNMPPALTQKLSAFVDTTAQAINDVHGALAPAPVVK